jgi:hypothetical protein
MTCMRLLLNTSVAACHFSVGVHIGKALFCRPMYLVLGGNGQESD